MILCRVFIPLLVVAAAAGAAVDPDAIGLSPLRREQPSLTGSGIPVGQSEAPVDIGAFEINPSAASQPASLFTWISSLGTATSFPNLVGSESYHADWVGGVFYHASGGVAPGVQHVRNYEANYYINSVINLNVTQPDQIVNNSWVAGISTNLDSSLDTYAADHNVLFVSGMDNATTTPQSPGSCYNGIGVGRSDGPSSIGPTSDGRCKPDIVLPGDLVSFLTPAVAGSAALLLQAARRSDGGTGTAGLATNAAIIKALLLNGAVKPSGWTNGTARPLDARWGAGNLNVYNAWLQLKAGRAAYIDASSASPVGSPHPPTGNTNNIAGLRGWDYNALSSANSSDAITHYYFQLPASGLSYIGTVSLVWERAAGASSAKNLDLFLYNLTGTNLLASSQSSVDNVEHLFATNLPPGRYDLQVLKHGGASQRGAENYSLVWDFTSPALRISRTGGNVMVAWPVNQAGLTLQSVASLNSPITWQTVSAAAFITNGQNTVTFSVTNPATNFRLFRP